MAKTSTERSQERRNRLRKDGVVRCEVYAPLSLHDKIKQFVRKLLKKPG